MDKRGPGAHSGPPPAAVQQKGHILPNTSCFLPNEEGTIHRGLRPGWDLRDRGLHRTLLPPDGCLGLADEQLPRAQGPACHSLAICPREEKTLPKTCAQNAQSGISPIPPNEWTIHLAITKLWTTDVGEPHMVNRNGREVCKGRAGPVVVVCSGAWP